LSYPTRFSCSILLDFHIKFINYKERGENNASEEDN